MTAGPITRKMREYKVVEQKIQRLTERKRPLVEKLIELERQIYGRDRRISTSFASQGLRQRVNE
jgi:flagellar biosynthesis/type III secretory pathway chaperone